MKYTEIFDRFWNSYSTQNPSAKRIFDLFTAENEQVVHDHIALRTFDDPRVNIEVITRLFREAGYQPKGEYHFEVKKIYGRHFEHITDPNAPKVFVSQLLTSQFSPYLQHEVNNALNSLGDEVYQNPELIFQGSIWGKFPYETYTKLREESEYAAWLLVYGYRANHFAIKVNELKKYKTLQQVNAFVKSHGYLMNTVDGEIYGTPEELLEQSSTKAEIIKVEFTDGVFEIPACFYEFTLRYPDASGALYGGFIAANADKIFESTNFYKKPDMM